MVVVHAASASRESIAPPPPPPPPAPAPPPPRAPAACPRARSSATAPRAARGGRGGRAARAARAASRSTAPRGRRRRARRGCRPTTRSRPPPARARGSPRRAVEQVGLRGGVEAARGVHDATSKEQLGAVVHLCEVGDDSSGAVSNRLGSYAGAAHGVVQLARQSCPSAGTARSSRPSSSSRPPRFGARARSRPAATQHEGGHGSARRVLAHLPVHLHREDDRARRHVAAGRPRACGAPRTPLPRRAPPPKRHATHVARRAPRRPRPRWASSAAPTGKASPHAAHARSAAAATKASDSGARARGRRRRRGAGGGGGALASCAKGQLAPLTQPPRAKYLHGGGAAPARAQRGGGRSVVARPLSEMMTARARSRARGTRAPRPWRARTGTWSPCGSARAGGTRRRCGSARRGAAGRWCPRPSSFGQVRMAVKVDTGVTRAPLHALEDEGQLRDLCPDAAAQGHPPACAIGLMTPGAAESRVGAPRAARVPRPAAAAGARNALRAAAEAAASGAAAMRHARRKCARSPRRSRSGSRSAANRRRRACSPAR